MFCWFQFLKCTHFLLFIVMYDSKWPVFGCGTVGLGSGKLWRAFCTFFGQFIDQTINWIIVMKTIPDASQMSNPVTYESHSQTQNTHNHAHHTKDSTLKHGTMHRHYARMQTDTTKTQTNDCDMHTYRCACTAQCKYITNALYNIFVHKHTHTHADTCKSLFLNRCPALQLSEVSRLGPKSSKVMHYCWCGQLTKRCHLLCFLQESPFPWEKLKIKSTDLWVLLEKLQTFNTDTCIQRAVWQTKPVKVPNLRVNV